MPHVRSEMYDEHFFYLKIALRFTKIANMFSNIDLMSGYYWIRVKKKNEWKITF